MPLVLSALRALIHILSVPQLLPLVHLAMQAVLCRALFAAPGLKLLVQKLNHSRGQLVEFHGVSVVYKIIQLQII